MLARCGRRGRKRGRLNSNGSTAWGQSDPEPMLWLSMQSAIPCSWKQPWPRTSFTVSKVDRSVGARLEPHVSGHRRRRVARVRPRSPEWKPDALRAPERNHRLWRHAGHRPLLRRRRSRPSWRDSTQPAAIMNSGIGTVNTMTDVAVDAQGNAFISGRRYNPSWFRLNQFLASGSGERDEWGAVCSCRSASSGSGGSLAADQAGNLYWRLSLNAENTGNEYLVKLVP